MDYSKITVGDELLIRRWPVPDNERIAAKVIRIAHYESAEDLFSAEGIDRTSSSSFTSIEEAVQKIYGHRNYEEAIRLYGVYAIELGSIRLITSP